MPSGLHGRRPIGLHAVELLFGELWIDRRDGVDQALQAEWVDDADFATDLHGTAEAEALAHRGDGDFAFGEDGTIFGHGDGFVEGEAVAFSALHHQIDAEFSGEIL